MKRLLNKWPQKVLALLLAMLAWFSIDQNTRSTSQRELSVPVTVEGRAEDQNVTGAPETVSITVYGETSQVNRLRPENFDAVLDLNGLEGEYEQTIDVVPPQGVRLLTIEPDTAIGVVESIRSKTISVMAATLGETSENTVLEPLIQPTEVTVRGRNSTLARVQRAVALISIPQEDAQVAITLVAVDADNKPVPEVVLEPNQVSVRLAREAVLYTRTLPLEITEPEPGEGLALSEFNLSKSTLRVAGPQETLATLESVSALVSPSAQAPTTQDLSAGEYTLEVAPRLPEGVFSLERINASFNLSTLPSEAPAAAPDDEDDNVPTDQADNEQEADDAASPSDDEQEATSGEDNDSTSAPIRRPGSAQDSGSDNNF